MWENVKNILNSMTGYRNFLEKEVTGKLAPLHHGWTGYFSCFGGLSLLFFLLQAATGIVLLAYYTNEASAGVSAMNATALWIFRKMHLVGSHLMVMIILIHMMKIYVTAAYRSPMEMHWMSGVVMMTAVLVMGVSGAMMPWAGGSYWTMGGFSAESSGVWGVLASLIKGTAESSISRQVVFHCGVIPAVIVVFMAVHFKMLRKTGIAEPL